MRYQVRFIDEDLPAFHQYLVRKCWAIVASFLPAGGGTASYRALFRRLKSVLSGIMEARQYCGQSFQCDAFLAPVEPGQHYRKVVPSSESEHTIRYLLTPGTTPGQLVGELSRECLRIVTEARPGTRIKGSGRQIRQQIRQLLKDHIYRSESCGEGPLCAVSEPIDLWARRFVSESAG